MVIRTSWAAMAMAASASRRSCASMNCSSSSRSAAVGSRAPLGAARGQVRLHRRPGSLQRAVRRGDTCAERRGGLASRPAEYVTGDQRRTLPRRQDLQRGQECQRDRLPLDDQGLGLLVARRGLVEQLIRVRLEPWHLGERAASGPPRVVSQHVQADIRGDPVQPRAELGVAGETGPAAPGLQERLLHRVLGLVERGEHPVAVDMQFAPMPFGEGGERGLIPRDRRRHGLISTVHRQPSLRSTSCGTQVLPRSTSETGISTSSSL